MSQIQATRLCDLSPGDSAAIVQVLARGPVRRRLLEMGFVRGAVLRVEKLAPLGDPMELIIKGYHLSLRREEGACILVELAAGRPLDPVDPPRKGRLGWVKRLMKGCRRP